MLNTDPSESGILHQLIKGIKENGFFQLSMPNAETLPFTLPTFEIDGMDTNAMGGFHFQEVLPTRAFRERIHETAFLYTLTGSEDITLTVSVRTADDFPFFRFRYQLCSQKPVKLTKINGRDHLVYFSIPLSRASKQVNAITLSSFSPLVHSYLPEITVIPDYAMVHGVETADPIIVMEYKNYSIWIAYEHGAEHPAGYLSYEFAEGRVTLSAREGNYYDGQVLDIDHGFTSVWFQAGICQGDLNNLCETYRSFARHGLSLNTESRKPYVYYNTWNYQERAHNLHRKAYLQDLNLERIKTEIDAAARMGIEIFVLDTGWYSKTGDWDVDINRFPDRLCEIRALLDSHNMKLGLWFDPIVAARSSEIVTRHPEYRMSWNGEFNCNPIWETEASYDMCLCSPYADWFAEKLVSLYHSLGVRYFKWDGVSQSGCNAPGHFHGGLENSPYERGKCYEYQAGLQLIHITEKLSESCPDAIVDLDVTEAGRFVGLGFLSAGRFFLVNNGPYAVNYDFPENFVYRQEHTVRIDPYTNLFFYPGPARSRICRQSRRYDRLLPSHLFLTHFLPDGPPLSQKNALASLVLGGNGIWGDLTSLSQEEINYFNEQLTMYKKVREDAADSYPYFYGEIGSSPEIVEKINIETGCGMVCFFTERAGEYIYYTHPNRSAVKRHVIGADAIQANPDNTVTLTVHLDEMDAKVVYFI